MTMPALEVKGVSRNFGGVIALRDVSFTVAEGEVMGLIGPNGAGKSTLFEIVSGNLPPSAGRISYFGTDCTASRRMAAATAAAAAGRRPNTHPPSREPASSTDARSSSCPPTR